MLEQGQVCRVGFSLRSAKEHHGEGGAVLVGRQWGLNFPLTYL